jgi:hypothetical protein
VLLDVGGFTPGEPMPVSIEPWGVRIIESTWPPRAHTESTFIRIKDIDVKEYEVH